MKRQPAIRPSTSYSSIKRRNAIKPRDGGMSPWRAMERKQFRALVAPPSSPDPKEGRKHVE
jgi:hypothetical protein